MPGFWLPLIAILIFLREQIFHDRGNYSAVHDDTGSTVEGTPSFDDAIEEMTTLTQRKVLLAPMLFVAGDHAKNDMAGDEPDSLRSILEEKGFTVECKIQGLGELQSVRNMYVQKAAEAIK